MTHYDYRVLPKPNGSLRLIEASKKRIDAAANTGGDSGQRRTPRHSEDGAGEFLALISTRADSGGFPHDGLSRFRRRLAGRHLHQRRAARHPAGSRTSPAPANICTIARTAGWPGWRDPPQPSTPAMPMNWPSQATRTSTGERAIRSPSRLDPARGGLCGQLSYGAHHAPRRAPARGRRGANERLNVAREDFDRVKATLTKCVRYGLESRNRAAHPAFRSIWKAAPDSWSPSIPVKWRRLRAILEKIDGLRAARATPPAISSTRPVPTPPICPRGRCCRSSASSASRSATAR